MLGTFQSAISLAQSRIDSLEEIIPRLKGQKKLEALQKISYELSFLDTESYFKYSQQGLEYALAERDSSYLASFLVELGYYYKHKGAYQEALNKFNRSLIICEKIKKYSTLSSAYTGLGSVYYELNLYDRALEYHTKSLAIKELENDGHDLSVSYNNIGLIYYKIDDPLRALEYYEKSLKLKLETKDTANSVINYINIGYAYAELLGEESKNKALEHFKTAIRLANKHNQMFRVGYAYGGISQVFISHYEYDSAKYYLNLSIEESVKNDYKKLESTNYYLLAKIAFQEEKYSLAINYLERSQAQLINLKDKNRIKNNYGLYASIFEARNMLDSAFYYQKKFSLMKDSIFNEELANNLASVQIATIEEQAQRKIADKDERISKGKLFSLFLLSILALSTALIVVIFRNYAQTSRINKQLNESNSKIEAQKKNLEKKNDELAEAQITIQNQNQVLKNINIDLDLKVQERTRELDRSNHELEKAVKDLDQFIYKTSHDLRGPIATMQGIINLGVMECKDPEAVVYFNTLHKVSNNLNNVLYRLIEVHETYQKKPVYEVFDPVKQIMKTANGLYDLSVELNIDIITELLAKDKWRGDVHLFDQIVENMMRSAVQYKDRSESMIKIRSEYVDGQLLLSFEDNGFGIQCGDEDKVFNIFYKGSPRAGGTGLEVYTAKIAVEKMGGTIRLKKARKNTIYEIHLPAIS
ncbi:MAG: sensor histidine kinase [Cyclobacteriaceae bacterium]|nr:sensor histidine kinase [Cyclobacteriaceae bacterium]